MIISDHQFHLAQKFKLCFEQLPKYVANNLYKLLAIGNNLYNSIKYLQSYPTEKDKILSK